MGQCYTASQSMIKKARGGRYVESAEESSLETDNRLHED